MRIAVALAATVNGLVAGEAEISETAAAFGGYGVQDAPTKPDRKAARA